MIYELHLNDKNVKEMCKYASIDHSLVYVPMTHLDVYEMNLLFGIYSLLGRGMTDISITESAVRELARPNNTRRLTKKQSESIAKSLVEKIKGVFSQDHNNMFDVFQCDYMHPQNIGFDGMRIKIWNENKDLFNQHKKNPYTLVKLSEFRSLRSVQAKIFYLILSQWKSIGRARFREEELMRIFGVTDKRQLKVLVDNLTYKMRQYFKSLCLETKKRVGQHGRHIDKVYVFTFFRKSQKKFVKKVSD